MNTLQAQPVLFTVFMRKIYLLIKKVIELHVSMSSCSHNQTDELESMFLMFLGKKRKVLWSYILEKNCEENKGTQNTLRTFWNWEKKGS